jgi:dUTP pyrophosphatase
MLIRIVYSDRAFALSRGTSGSAGWDIKASESYVLKPDVVTAIDTGIRLEIPDGYEAQVRSRSGLAAEGVMIANGVGTIDSDYRGVIKVLLVSFNRMKVINRGDKIAQILIKKLENVEFIPVDKLDKTVRGENGFGSTGR